MQIKIDQTNILMIENFTKNRKRRAAPRGRILPPLAVNLSLPHSFKSLLLYLSISISSSIFIFYHLQCQLLPSRQRLLYRRCSWNASCSLGLTTRYENRRDLSDWPRLLLPHTPQQQHNHTPASIALITDTQRRGYPKIPNNSILSFFSRVHRTSLMTHSVRCDAVRCGGAEGCLVRKR